MNDSGHTTTESLLPQAPLGGGPVLCMNIAGAVLTAADKAHQTGFPRGCHAGFTEVWYKGKDLSVHPALPRWFDELEQAYAHCAWTSGFREKCAAFAHTIGLSHAEAWPYLRAPGPFVSPLWARLNDVAAWIDPHAPVAVVDFRLASVLLRQNHSYLPPMDIIRESIPLFLKRPGPTLLVAPALHIGLSRRIVDLLCRFAHDPVAPAFAVRGVHRMHVDPAQRWPDPLPPDLEEPVVHPLLPREGNVT